MSIQFRFYRDRFNMDPSYYEGEDDIYCVLYFKSFEELKTEWNDLVNTSVCGYALEGETYSAWSINEDGVMDMICGGAFDLDDIDLFRDYFGEEE